MNQEEPEKKRCTHSFFDALRWHRSVNVYFSSEKRKKEKKTCLIFRLLKMKRAKKDTMSIQWRINGGKTAENEASVGSRAKRHAFMLREWLTVQSPELSVFVCLHTLWCCLPVVVIDALMRPRRCAHVHTSTACVMCFCVLCVLYLSAICNCHTFHFIPHGIFFFSLLLFSHLISISLSFFLGHLLFWLSYRYIYIFFFHHVLRLCLSVSGC